MAHNAGDAPEKTPGMRISRDRLDLGSALLLGVAALATSWIGYESSRWSGRQGASVNESNTLRMHADRCAAETDMLRMVDIGSYTNWVNAYASGNQKLEDFYRARFRKEFRPAFEAWLARKPMRNPDAPPNPFAMSEYRLATRDSAVELEARADSKYRESESQGGVKDRYVAGTVLFAAAMFFAGISRQFPRLALQAAVLAFAGLLCLAGLFMVFRLPVIL